ncbi:YodD family peroxide/acid resistance protein [Erwinia sp. MMLR14_017]|uniref:YodD family peroxide/acid resistance protein n=1 Tax=Erwinia sp. MMLR14_017 TaxID=3093842 RepID=UPI0029906445|nr:YodD family peroxide/acid resistance protein [Erwinia sp. MMLR14_017]MDW8846701.1 YodD family peroxide/acid resistance protein [Erwinia sp. MMLR14_017]
MATAKEYSDIVQREVSIDIEALLEAIHDRSTGEVTTFTDDKQAHKVRVDGREYHSYTELADAFELDIRDFTVSEVNR